MNPKKEWCPTNECLDGILVNMCSEVNPGGITLHFKLKLINHIGSKHKRTLMPSVRHVEQLWANPGYKTQP